MRLEKLKLTRYGSFTNRVIDFGQPGGEGGSKLDFHIMFGPNEAGKSTLRSAFIDFLYGFERQSNFAFLHQINTLQLEATISAGQTRHELIRVKRASKSLLGADNQPLGDDLLLPLLGRVNRESYESMFSLDEDLLEEGGQSILESRGDLSELLFSSASGLSALSAELAAIRLDTEQFFKPRGRTLRLNEMTKQLKSLKIRMKELDVPAAQYDARSKAVRTAHENHTAALAERSELSAARNRLKALLDCVEPWRDYLEIQPSLQDAEELPVVPDGWLAEAQQLATEASTLEALVDQCNRRVKQTHAYLSEIQVAANVLEAGPQIDRLTQDDIEVKFRAAADTETTQASLDALLGQIAQCTRRLNAPRDREPHELLLPVARVGQIKELVVTHSGLDTNLRLAAEEVERAQEELKLTQKAFATANKVPDLSALARLVAVIRDDGDERDLNRLTAQLHNQQAEVDAAVLLLEPWQGTAGELDVLVVPAAEELDELQQQERSIIERSAALTPEAERLAAKLARLNAEKQALLARGDLIEDHQAVRSRAERDQAWQEHRAALLDNPLSPSALDLSARRFESLLLEDDRLVGARFMQAREVAALRELDMSIARTRADQQQLDIKLRELAGQREQNATDLANVCNRLGLPATFTLSRLKHWLQLRREALGGHRKSLLLQNDRDRVARRASDALASLHAALAEVTTPSTAENWRLSLQLADDLIAQWRAQQLAEQERKRALATGEQEVESRTRRLSSARAAMDAWKADWSAALDGLWPAAGARLPAIAEMNEILRALDELGVLIEKAKDNRRALESMRSNRQRYLQEVTHIADALDVAVNRDNPLDTADQLRALLLKARDDERRMQEKHSELDDLEKELASANDRLALSQSRFAQMTTLFPADSYTALLELMRRSEDHQRLVQQRARLQRQLPDLLGVASFAEAEEALQAPLANSESIGHLRLEHEAMVAAAEAADENVSRLYHEWKAAQSALGAIGNDAEVARLNEQARVLLMDIEAEAKRFISLSAGTLVVERALRSYLDTHRSSMLKRASAAFATITRGAFTGLDAMPGIAGKSKEELVGIRRDGSSISATEMSRGSRFQLYLSLRIAGYHEFVAERDPLPFFADDILETFDDDRSAETFGLMAEMARHGQVIYLTHHRHLCEIASEVTRGQARIHELPARSLNV